MFIDFIKKEWGYFTYGDNNQGNILGEDIVGNYSTTTINDVFLVKWLKCNLISISKLWYKKGMLTFFIHIIWKEYLKVVELLMYIHWT